MEIGLKPVVDAFLSELKAAPPEKIAEIINKFEATLTDLDGTVTAARDDLNLLQPVLVDARMAIAGVANLAPVAAGAMTEIRELIALYKKGFSIVPIQ